MVPLTFLAIGSFESSRARVAAGRLDLICRFKQDVERLTGRCGPDFDSGASVSGEFRRRFL